MLPYSSMHAATHAFIIFFYNLVFQFKNIITLHYILYFDNQIVVWSFLRRIEIELQYYSIETWYW